MIGSVEQISRDSPYFKERVSMPIHHVFIGRGLSLLICGEAKT